MDRDDELFVIRLNYDVSGTIVQLPASLREKIKSVVKAEDTKLGIDLNCYNNDDYLFVAGMFYHAHNVYRTMAINPVEKKWIDGCADIPHVVIRVLEKPCFKEDENGMPVLDENGIYIPDDKKLNAGISRPFYQNGVPFYVFEFNRYMLQRFVMFLQDVFDKNEELVIAFDGSSILLDDARECTADEVLPQFNLASKSKILKIAQDLWACGLVDWGYALMRESAYMSDDELVPEPCMLLWSKDDPDKGLPLGFAYSDPENQRMYAPVRKQIYNTTGFYRYFARRNTLISELFEEAIRMIVYHEFFHIANGHGLLMEADESYAKRKDIAVCAEQNADDSAMRMMICELLYDTKDGNPVSTQLIYTRNELIHKWSIRIFSSYLALSRIFRGEDRPWSEDVLTAYQNNDTLTHPLYHFRVHNVLNCAFNRLQALVECKELTMTTAEGLAIDKAVVERTINEAMEFVNSFEANFRSTYEDSRPTEDRIRDSWIAKPKNIPAIPEEIPLLFTMMSERAAKEAAQIRAIWPELKSKLREIGAYNLRFSSI